MLGSETPWGPDMFRLIDEHVGFRLRERREALDVPQSKLADHLDVCTNTLVKYESGERSIPASDFYDAANFLGVPMGYFYEGLDDWVAAIARSNGTPFTRAAR